MKILVTGAKGQLGSELRELAPIWPDFDLLFTDVDELDITDQTAVNQYFQYHKPASVINCAAYTAVDKAENDRENAFLINATAPGILAQAASATGALLVHVSTDYVFDGNGNSPYAETDIANPLTVYGLSKYAGEKAVEQFSDRAIIIRTSWLYSAFGNNFVKTIRKRAIESGELRVVNDQFGSPTYARDLAAAILEILPQAANNQGVEIYHYANSGIITWFDFAKAITEISGINCLIHPVTTGEYPVAAKRPVYSAMNTVKIRQQFGIEIQDWRTSLQHCIARLA